MADVSISVTALTEGTRSGDLVAGGTAVNAGQSFSIAAGDVTATLVIVMEEVGGGAATVTFDAGDYPPAARQGLGARAIALAASDLRLIVLEGARHIQSDGAIEGSVATNNCRISAFRIPKTI